MTMTKQQRVNRLMVRLSRRDDGFSRAELQSELKEEAWLLRGYISKAVAEGLIVPLPAGVNQRTDRRWFHSNAAAAAYVRRVLCAGLHDVERSPTTGRVLHPPVNLPGSMGKRMDPGAAARRQPGVRLVHGPSWTHDPRFQCAPGEQPFGAGFAAAGVGRDVETGWAWGQAA